LNGADHQVFEKLDHGAQKPLVITHLGKADEAC